MFKLLAARVDEYPTGTALYLAETRTVHCYNFPAGTRVKVVGRTRNHVTVRRYVMIPNQDKEKFSFIVFNVKPHLLSKRPQKS